MRGRETTSIAVCALGAPELEHAVETVREGGGWSIVPIHWPNAPALAATRHTAEAYLLHGGETGPCEELTTMLGERRSKVPLIVVGKEPVRRAHPDVWLPSLPPAALLAAIIDNLLEDKPIVPATPTLSFRRKTDMIIGHSPAITQLIQTLDQLAPAQTPVTITGESGTGKELVARALHFCGPRAKHSFIAINCAAIPETLFEAELFGYMRGAFTGAVANHVGAIEAAHNGTLFLDEIGEMPLAMQAKLLRVLESSEVQRIGSTERRKINVRLVTATNRNLEKAVKDGQFREDLYYRVVVYPVHVAPLRERPEDIPPIVTHHLSAIASRENRPALRVTAAALEKLVSYSWPGNVRELVNLLERAVLQADRTIDAEHIRWPQGAPRPTASSSLVPYREAKTRFELEYFSQLMRTADGNVSLAAKLSRKTRKEIYDALKRLGLDAAEYRHEENRE